MKLGGRDEISTPEAIAGLAVITTICLLLSFWEPVRILARVFASETALGIVILWQIDFNVALRRSRSDSKSASTVWNIFQTVGKNRKEEK